MRFNHKEAMPMAAMDGSGNDEVTGSLGDTPSRGDVWPHFNKES